MYKSEFSGNVGKFANKVNETSSVDFSFNPDGSVLDGEKVNEDDYNRISMNKNSTATGKQNK